MVPYVTGRSFEHLPVKCSYPPSELVILLLILSSSYFRDECCPSPVEVFYFQVIYKL